MSAVDVFKSMIQAMRDAGLDPLAVMAQAETEQTAAQQTATGVVQDASGAWFYNGVAYADLSKTDKNRVNAAKARIAKASKTHTATVAPVAAPVAHSSNGLSGTAGVLYSLIIALSEQNQAAEDPKYRTANVKFWRIRKAVSDLGKSATVAPQFKALTGLDGAELLNACNHLATVGKLNASMTYSGEPRFCPDVFASYARPTSSRNGNADAQARKRQADERTSDLARRVSAQLSR
jgi:hypothetical protein